MDLMQPEVAPTERTDLQSRTLTPPPTRGLTESTDTVRVLSNQGFTAIYGTRSAEALTAFNADAVQRGPGVALDQLAERPGAYAPGVEASPTSRALAGALRLSVPGTEAPTDGRADTRTEGQTVSPDGLSVNGVSTKTPFPKEVGPYETQEMVMQRAYEEYAARAGISRQPAYGEAAPGEGLGADGASQSLTRAEEFANERIEANRAANGGDARVYNPRTDKPYTDAEWSGFQGAGTITMYPTDEDVVALRNVSLQSGLDDGARAAETVVGLLNSDNRFAADQLRQAMQGVEANGGNAAFQAGFVNTLQADGFIRLSKALESTPQNNAVLANALASESAYRTESGGSPSVAVEVARTADPLTLARLTSDTTPRISTEFLVEAAKAIRNTTGDDYGQNRDAVLKRAAEDPSASLQLLQDPDFIWDAAVQKFPDRYGPYTSVLSGFVTSGVSAQMRDADPAQVATALRNVIEVLGQRDGTPIPGGGLVGRGTYNVMDGSLAAALTDAYVTNTSTFTDAAALPRGRDGQLDGTDVRSLLAAIQPYAATTDPLTRQTLEDRILAATAVEYTQLMNRAATTGSTADAAAAGNLAGAVVDGTSRANLAEARAADARQEKLARFVSIAAELGTAGALSGSADLVVKVLSKATATETVTGLKGNSVDRAGVRNDALYNRQLSTNNTAVLDAVERASMTTDAARTPDQRVQADQFVRDLRTYNTALPAGEKILDVNGRLVRTSDANEAQLSHMERLVTNRVPVGSTSEEVRQAAGRLSERVRPMLESVNGATGLQIKR